MSNLIEKSIKELLGKEFNIPSYQRGYRWTKTQVTDLLNDVWEFSNKKSKKSKESNEWYCLQPIVVRETDNEMLNVLDGQQRLTTIFLILKYFTEDLNIKMENELYTISYETRESSQEVLKNLNFDLKDNIDFHHMKQAYQTITERFSEEQDRAIDANQFLETFLNDTKVIWYEVSLDSDDEKENIEKEIEIFTRINMGKIPLTNSELIKALFLNSSNFNTPNDNEIRLKQLEIASEWDSIEYALQNEQLWYFITSTQMQKYETKIDYLFELIRKIEGDNDVGTDKATFRYFSNKFKDNSKDEIEKNWAEIKKTFQKISEWFEDKELYHKIGYLISTDFNIIDLLKINKGKEDFIHFINIKIKKTINFDFENLVYPSNDCKKFLLLHNVHTMLQNDNSTTRFPFDKYKKERWDIEHIHATATEVNINKKNVKDWLTDNFIPKNKENNANYNEEKEKLIEKVLKEDEIKDIESQIDKIVNYVLGEDDDDIRNLCLLDRKTNRSYKNDSFRVKRQKLIAFEKEGTFVPICTRNVFLKYYSDKLKDMDLWNESDREKYKEDLNKTFDFYKNIEK